MIIPTTQGNVQASDIAVEVATPMIGGASRQDFQTTISNVDLELAILFEDRNARFVGGGTISLNSGGTTLTFGEQLDFVYNNLGTWTTVSSVVAASGTITFSANGQMAYITLNRSAGTAVLTTGATTLPAASSTSQEIFLVAIRRDDLSGTQKIYLNDSTTVTAGNSTSIGGGSATSIFSTGVTTIDSLSSNLTISSGDTLTYPNLTVGSGYTVTVNGSLFVPGRLQGPGKIAGAGPVFS